MSNMQYEQISNAGNDQILKILKTEEITLTQNFKDINEKTAKG